MSEYGPRIEIENNDGIITAKLLDKEILEERTINDIQESLFSLVEDQPRIKLIVNFIKVKHLSSSALGTLIRLNKRVEEGGGALTLCEIKPSLYEVFVITKLNRLFDIYESLKEALDSYSE